MDSAPNDASLQQLVKITQIIATALIVGVLSFGAVVVVLTLNRKPEPPPVDGQAPPPAFAFTQKDLIFCGFAAAGLVLHFIVPVVLTRVQLQSMRGGATDAASAQELGGDLAQLYQIQFIVGAALLEGSAFMMLAMAMQERPYGLWAAGAFLLLMIFNFPTYGRVVAWLERQRDVLADPARDLPGRDFD